MSLADLRGYTVIEVRRGIAGALLLSALAITVLSFILYISWLSRNPAGLTVSMAFAALTLLSTAMSIVGYAKNKILGELAEALRKYGLHTLSSVKVEVGRIRIKGHFTHGRYRVYVTSSDFEKLGEVFPGLGLPISTPSGLILVNGEGEGILYGHCLRVVEGRYRGFMIIPIQPSLPSRRVEERLEGDGDSAVFSLELGGCVVRGYIAVLSRSRARSYRVELRSSERGLSTRIYSGGPGPFEYSYPCTPIAIVLWGRAVDLREIASRVREALGIGGREFSIGYEGGALRLALVIDIPMARDISKEIPL